MSRTATMYNAQQGHEVLQSLWQQAKPRLLAGHRLRISLAEETRSLPQNDRMWALISEISAQVNWYGQRLTKEEWKDVLTASLKKQKVVPGLDGEFVVLGAHTSTMSKADLSALMDLIEAFGAQQGVKFKAPNAQ